MTVSKKGDYGYNGDLTAQFASWGGRIEIFVPEHAEPGDILTFKAIEPRQGWKADLMLVPDGTARDNQLHAHGRDKVAAMKAVRQAVELAAQRRAEAKKQAPRTDNDELAAL